MGYKRAEWHSGLTYRQVCPQCKNVMEYTDDKLGFRPWYPDGFVYCTGCKTPLRHNEAYAIGNPYEVWFAPESTADGADKPAFCTCCGEPFRDRDRFCAMCGIKR